MCGVVDASVVCAIDGRSVEARTRITHGITCSFSGMCVCFECVCCELCNARLRGVTNECACVCMCFCIYIRPFTIECSCYIVWLGASRTRSSMRVRLGVLRHHTHAHARTLTHSLTLIHIVRTPGRARASAECD